MKMQVPVSGKTNPEIPPKTRGATSECDPGLDDTEHVDGSLVGLEEHAVVDLQTLTPMNL